MQALHERPFVPAKKGTPPLTGAALATLTAQLPNAWTAVDGRLARTYKVADFSTALALAVRIGMLAEKLEHHPELTVRWGALVVTTWTHTVDGLAEGDFVLAARCDVIAT